MPVAMLLVAVATVIGQLVASRWGADPVVLLYIPPVLLVAVYWGLWPSLAASVAATLAYNFYFTVPFHTFRIQSPVDIATVVILFIVALVTSRLAGAVTRTCTIGGKPCCAQCDNCRLRPSPAFLHQRAEHRRRCGAGIGTAVWMQRDIVGGR